LQNARPPNGKKKRQAQQPPVELPAKVRGVPIFSHPQFASMQRPCPQTQDEYVAYISLRDHDAEFKPVLKEAYEFIGLEAAGYLTFAAQRVIAVIFSDVTKRNNYIGKHLPQSFLEIYGPPTDPVDLRKYTLQRLPLAKLQTAANDIKAALAPWGELVDFTPLRGEDTQWYTDVAHVTLNRAKGHAVPPEEEPPEQITVCGKTVLVDIPGKRRVCRFCLHSEHIDPECRQGQRIQKAAENKAKRDAKKNKTAYQPPVPTWNSPLGLPPTASQADVFLAVGQQQQARRQHSANKSPPSSQLQWTKPLTSSGFVDDGNVVEISDDDDDTDNDNDNEYYDDANDNEIQDVEMRDTSYNQAREIAKARQQYNQTHYNLRPGRGQKKV
jgi:hypothetical protein